MNQKEARTLLTNHVQELKKLSYADLHSWVVEKKIETPAVKGPSGTDYQIEIQALWDNEHRLDIRVLVSIDDGGWLSSFLPLCESFVVSSDGSLVGE